MKKNLLFITNPVAGGKDKSYLKRLINEYLDQERYCYDYEETQKPGEAHTLAAEAVKQGTDAVIVCGGDGTVNEAGSSLIHTNTALGIIPAGSGNGLARHLKLPLKPEAAIDRINQFRIREIDAGFVNEHPFFNVSGIGFDAHVGEEFAKMKARGFFSYAKAVMRSVFSYRPSRVHVESAQGEFNDQAFIISFANSSQYGNNTYINPQAQLDDGKIEICILEPFPSYLTPMILKKVLTQKLPGSKYFRVIPVEEAEIDSSECGSLHIDGEPFPATNHIRLHVEKKCLKVIV